MAAESSLACSNMSPGVASLQIGLADPRVGRGNASSFCSDSTTEKDADSAPGSIMSDCGSVMSSWESEDSDENEEFKGKVT